MKQSDSTTSLSKLNTSEPLCVFCSQEDDPEAGLVMVDAKQFLACECHIQTHLKCWSEYVGAATEGPIGCPNCQKTIAGWRRKLTVEEQDTISMKDMTRGKIALLAFVVCLMIALISLVVYYTALRT